MSTKTGSTKKAKSKQAENGANEGMSMNLLDELESQVKAAAERIRSLNEENRRLSTRVESLKEELEEARKAAGGEGGEEKAAWAEERDEVRRRLEGLTRTLEDLLADEEEDEDDGDSEDDDDDEDGGSEEE